MAIVVTYRNETIRSQRGWSADDSTIYGCTPYTVKEATGLTIDGQDAILSLSPTEVVLHPWAVEPMRQAGFLPYQIPFTGWAVARIRLTEECREAVLTMIEEAA